MLELNVTIQLNEKQLQRVMDALGAAIEKPDANDIAGAIDTIRAYVDDQDEMVAVNDPRIYIESQDCPLCNESQKDCQCSKYGDIACDLVDDDPIEYRCPRCDQKVYHNFDTDFYRCENCAEDFAESEVR